MTLFICVLSGFIVGLFYFWTLRRNTALYAKAKLAAAVATQATRFIAATVFFFVLARLGALPLLAGFAGFLVSRPAAFLLLKARP